jgi:hypothetical protein
MICTVEPPLGSPTLVSMAVGDRCPQDAAQCGVISTVDPPLGSPSPVSMAAGDQFPQDAAQRDDLHCRTPFRVSYSCVYSRRLILIISSMAAGDRFLQDAALAW